MSHRNDRTAIVALTPDEAGLAADACDTAALLGERLMESNTWTPLFVEELRRLAEHIRGCIPVGEA